MITALQNFISKKGKFVFVLLLFVVVISFVLYLAQGASVFDLLPDPNKEKKELYGVDLNDPDEMRFFSIENRIASDFGAIIPPLEESMEEADAKFLESLQLQLQSAFQANQADIDRSALQRLFSFMQSWPNLPKNFKAREIARSGGYDPVFSQAAIRAKLVMEGQARSWNYLSDSENHPGINDGFNRYVRELDPALATDENRSRALQFVGTRQGVKTIYVESALFAHFRANQVDQIYSEGGFTLEKEGELDLFRDQFAWKAGLLSLQSADLNISNAEIQKFSFIEQPAADDFISFSYGQKSGKLVFVENAELNSSDVQVKLGNQIAGTIQNLMRALQTPEFEFVLQAGPKNSVFLTPRLDQLPRQTPQFSSSTERIKITALLEEKLRSFHEERKSDPVFSEPARTFATMVTFPFSNYLSLPPEPQESRLRSYFDLNRDQFEPVPVAPEPVDLPEGEKGPKGESDNNQSEEKLDFITTPDGEVNESIDLESLFEEVKEEIRLRIIEEDRLDAEREAKGLAQEASLKFLDQINSLRDQIKSKYPNFIQRRNSVELKSLLEESGGKERKISFATRDMSVQGAILGLERRESERRSNREPLEEVSMLNETLFFTQSTRIVRDGYAVFVLDRKTEKGAGEFQNASFADLYREYSTQLRSDRFTGWAEKTLSLLQGDGDVQEALGRGKHITIDRKSLSALEGMYNAKNQRIQSRLSKLEEEREEISKAERDKNATASQISRKSVLDQAIDDLRIKQEDENRNRSLSIQLANACPNLELGEGWSELERGEDTVVFVKLEDVYTLKAKQSEEEDIFTRVDEIERSRGELDRDLILENLLNRELAKNSSN